MSTKTILFLLAFAVASGAALFIPLAGVLGYVAHYSIGPEQQWWEVPIRRWGIRYSLVLAVMTAIGILLNHHKLAYGKRLLVGQEVLMLLFLGVVWLLVLVGEPTKGLYSLVDHPSVKVTKVIVFALMLTHVATRLRHLDWLFWVLVLGALVLGLQAYRTPRSAFAEGRLETVGGPDFRDSNTLAAYLGAILPIIGVMFLRSGWIGKGVCLLSGAFATNAIILTRSRGAIVGIAAGVLLAIVLAPRKHRSKIAAGLIVATMGLFYLADPAFLERTSTIAEFEYQRDTPAQSRIKIWKGGVMMLVNNPMGVGVGNFQQNIGKYAPAYSNRDAHNTYIRCAAEMGVLGLTVLAALIANAVVTLWRVIRQVQGLPREDHDHVVFLGYGMLISLTIFLVSGIFGSLVYIEAFWWLLALPVCLSRAGENLREDAQEKLEQEASGPTVPGRLPASVFRRPRRTAKVSHGR